MSRVSIAQIIATVAGQYGLTPGDLTGPRQNGDVALPRMIAMVLAHELTPHTQPKIARAFDRLAPAVSYAIRRVEELAARDPAVRGALTELRGLLPAALVATPLSDPPFEELVDPTLCLERVAIAARAALRHAKSAQLVGRDDPGRFASARGVQARALAELGEAIDRLDLARALEAREAARAPVRTTRREARHAA